MPDFNVYGKLIIEVNMDIDNTVDCIEARKLAIKKIVNDHHLDIEGYSITEEDCNFSDLIAIEYDD